MEHAKFVPILNFAPEYVDFFGFLGCYRSITPLPGLRFLYLEAFYSAFQDASLNVRQFFVPALPASN